MILQISTKNTKFFLYKAIFYILLAIIIFVLCSKNINLFSAITMIGGLYLLLKGYLYFFDVIECKGKSFSIRINNNILYIDNNSIYLKDKFLFLNTQKCDNYFKVFLYDENRLILKAILDEKEYIKFFKLIKPYKKLPLYLKETYGVFICKESFSIDGKEFFYDEIVLIEWEIKTDKCIFTYCSKAIYVYIRLKNNTLITAKYQKDYLILEKLLFIKNILEGKKNNIKYDC